MVVGLKIHKMQYVLQHILQLLQHGSHYKYHQFGLRSQVVLLDGVDRP